MLRVPDLCVAPNWLLIFLCQYDDLATLLSASALPGVSHAAASGVGRGWGAHRARDAQTVSVRA